ncbi:MAG TPA: SRPBCC domain-containing protein [Kofleriaceae bacterium]|nr:SRPBCC domain-containing protein [Kofleriaceae bacterium]
MNKLQVSTEVPTEIRVTRTFDAPRRLVVKAMMTPELMKRWMGGERATVTAVEIDARVGGRYRYAFRNNRDGSEFALSGVFREVADDHVVFTQAMEGAPGEIVVTTTWSDDGPRTTMTVVMTFPSREMRDMVAATGMTDGMGETYDVLEQLAATLA